MYFIRKSFSIIVVIILLGTYSASGSPMLKAYEEANRFSIDEINALKGKIEKEYESDQTLENAIKLMLIKHNYALVKRNKESVDDGISTIKALYLKFKSPLLLAYLGSMETMRGDLNTDSGLKTAWVKRGIRKMDKAVKLIENGDDLMVFVRMLRGNNYLKLPKMMKKTKSAIEDFRWVYENIYKPNPASFKGENGGSLLYSYGKACELEGHLEMAVRLYEECTQKYRGTEYCRKAESEIEELKR